MEKAAELFRDKLVRYQDELEKVFTRHQLVDAGIAVINNIDFSQPTDNATRDVLYEIDRFFRVLLISNSSFSVDAFEHLISNIDIERAQSADITQISRVLLFYWRYSLNLNGNLGQYPQLAQWFQKVTDLFHFPVLEVDKCLSEKEKSDITKLLEGELPGAGEDWPIEAERKLVIGKNYSEHTLHWLGLLQEWHKTLSGTESPQTILRILKNLVENIEHSPNIFSYSVLDRQVKNSLEQTQPVNLKNLPVPNKLWSKYFPETHAWLKQTREAAKQFKMQQRKTAFRACLNEPFPWHNLCLRPEIDKPKKIHQSSLADALESLQLLATQADRTLKRYEMEYADLHSDLKLLLERLAKTTDNSESSRLEALEVMHKNADAQISAEFRDFLDKLMVEKKYQTCIDMLRRSPAKADCSLYPELLLAQGLLTTKEVGPGTMHIDEVTWEKTPEKIRVLIQNHLYQLLESDKQEVNQLPFVTYWFNLPQFIKNDAMCQDIDFVRHCIAFLENGSGMSELLENITGNEDYVIAWLNAKDGLLDEVAEAIVSNRSLNAKINGLKLYFAITSKSVDILNLLEKIIAPKLDKVALMKVEQCLSTDMQLIHNFLGFFLLNRKISKKRFIVTCERLAKNSYRYEIIKRWPNILDDFKSTVKNTNNAHNLRYLLEFCKSVGLVIRVHEMPRFIDNKTHVLGKAIGYLNNQYQDYLRGQYDVMKVVRELYFLQGCLDDDEKEIIYYRLGDEGKELEVFKQQVELMFDSIPLCRPWFENRHFNLPGFSHSGFVELESQLLKWQRLYFRSHEKLAGLSLLTRIHIRIKNILSKVSIHIQYLDVFESCIKKIQADALGIFPKPKDIQKTLTQVKELVKYDDYLFIFGEKIMTETAGYFEKVKNLIPPLQEVYHLRNKIGERDTIGVNHFDMDEIYRIEKWKNRLKVLQQQIKASF